MMKCQHLLKKDRAAYKLYAKDTTEDENRPEVA